jgi:hypothetical protein
MLGEGAEVSDRSRLRREPEVGLDLAGGWQAVFIGVESAEVGHDLGLTGRKGGSGHGVQSMLLNLQLPPLGNEVH